MTDVSDLRERVALLPCPFCGKELSLSKSGMATHADQSQGDCIIGSMGIPTDHPASVAKWNTRADAALAEISVLQNQLDEAINQLDSARHSVDVLERRLAEMGGVRVKPLRWEHHPWGTIAAPPTGHAYIIDTRMKGRVYSLKGFNPQREFASIDEAKAAAQADYEARILAAIAALEPMDKPRVKPLEWRVDDSQNEYAQAQYSVDRYCIEHRLHADDAFDLWIGPDATTATRFPALEAAKAAAQADYEARILAALEPVTVQEAREDALRALLERALPLVEEGLGAFWKWDDDGPDGEGWPSGENTTCREALEAWCAEVKKALGESIALEQEE